MRTIHAAEGLETFHRKAEAGASALLPLETPMTVPTFALTNVWGHILETMGGNKPIY